MDVDLAQESREVELIPIDIQFVLGYNQIKVKMFMFQLIIKLDYKILSLNFNTNLEEMKKKKSLYMLKITKAQRGFLLKLRQDKPHRDNIVVLYYFGSKE